MKFRIAIQSIENNIYKHEHNIMLESDSKEEIIKKMRTALEKEIEEREKLLMDWIHSRRPDMIDNIIKNTDSDLIDWKSKGKDISKKEFLENEIEVDTKW